MPYPADVQRELDRAAQARSENNDGKMRVCCRRAVGAAFRRWAAAQPDPPAWGAAAITQLRTMAEEPSLPSRVRNAAARLSTTVSRDHTLPFDNDPIADAITIIDHFKLTGQ